MESLRAGMLPNEAGPSSSRTLRNANNDSPMRSSVPRKAKFKSNQQSPTSLSQFTGNPYLDAEREREAKRMQMDRRVRNTKTLEGNDAAQSESESEEELLSHKFGKGKRTEANDDSPRSKPAQGQANGTKESKKGKGKAKGKTKGKRKGKKESKKQKNKERTPSSLDEPVAEVFVVDGIVRAEYATYEDDDGVPVTCWYYRVKWHNYHLEDTILERPITWRMFGPRPNDMPISFWAELRRRQEVPPLKNPEKARTMKRELFRMRDEEDEREAAREKGESSSLNVVDKTEHEWEQLWADLGPEWEPDGALGAVYHAPIRVENKWTVEALENYLGDKRDLETIRDQCKTSRDKDKLAEIEGKLKDVDKHIAHAQRRVESTQNEILRLGLRPLRPTRDVEDDITTQTGPATRPASPSASALPSPPAVNGLSAAQVASESPAIAVASNHSKKRSREMSDSEGMIGPPRKKASAQLSRSMPPSSMTSPSNMPTNELPPIEEIFEGASKEFKRPSSQRRSPERNGILSYPEPRKKRSLFHVEDSASEADDDHPRPPSAPPKTPIHQPRWELLPSANDSPVSPPVVARAPSPLLGLADEATADVAPSDAEEHARSNGSMAVDPLESVESVLFAVHPSDAVLEATGPVDVTPHAPSLTVATTFVEPPSTAGIASAELSQSPAVTLADAPRSRPPIPPSTVTSAPRNGALQTSRPMSILSTPPNGGPLQDDQVAGASLSSATKERDLWGTSDAESSPPEFIESRRNSDIPTMEPIDVDALSESSADVGLKPMVPPPPAAPSVPTGVNSSTATQQPSKIARPQHMLLRSEKGFRLCLRQPQDTNMASHFIAQVEVLPETSHGACSFTSMFASSEPRTVEFILRLPVQPAAQLMAGRTVHQYGTLLLSRHVPSRDRQQQQALLALTEGIDTGGGSVLFAQLEDKLAIAIWNSSASQALKAPWALNRPKTLCCALLNLEFEAYIKNTSKITNHTSASNQHSQGGIITFPPLFIVKEPLLFSRVVQALRDNPYWVAYMSPQTLAHVASMIMSSRCSSPAVVLAAVMDMLTGDVVKLQSAPTGATLQEKLHQQVLEDDLKLAGNNWNSLVKACQAFPMARPPFAIAEEMQGVIAKARGLDIQKAELEVTQLEHLTRMKSQARQLVYVGSDWSILQSVKFEKHWPDVKYRTAEEFLDIIKDPSQWL